MWLLAACLLLQVQSLMGCLLYAGRLDKSPYSALLSEDLWREAVETLYVDGCRLLGLPVEGPLSICYRAGLAAMGPMGKMKSVVVNSKGDWDSLHVSQGRSPRCCPSRNLGPGR